ncbi:hypothetical protein D3C87_1465970 [compost metagenome]
MKTKKLRNYLLFIPLFSLLLSSCEKESGTGNYIIGISNSTQKNYSISVSLDGENKGSFIVKATQQGNYASLCNDLVHAAQLDNVLVLNYVPSGSHKLVLKESSTGQVMATKDFELKADGCISQQFNL